MSQNQISSDNLASIGGINITIDPKILICSICCCINYKCVQCKNKNCMKLFCNECSFKIRMKNENCPFCRMPYEYKKAEELLYEILNNILFYCNKSTQCREQYSLSSFNEHCLYHNNAIEEEKKCNSCQKRIINNDPNSAKCGMCLRIFCFSNITYNAFHLPDYPKVITESNCLRKCFECKLPICFNCNAEEKSNNIICDNCELQCSKCNGIAKVICSFCNQRLCNDCKMKCDECKLIYCIDKQCYITKSNDCSNCNNTLKQNYYKCIHHNYFSCNICYLKCSRCNIIKGNVKCITCNSLLCINSCSIKCKHCFQATCLDCSVLCSICKAVLCSKCSKRCNACPKDQTLITCLKCNSDTIRTCSFPDCKEMLCLSCWNLCNYCNTIFCSNHSITCLNCQQSMCNQHYQTCKKCSKDSSYKKLCLKKCSYQCAFCPNISNALCNKNNHLLNYVTSYNCEHYVCLSCIKTCYKCKKAVVTCPKCIVNYYFTKCKFCNNYLCNTCSVQCNNCENTYCDLKHTCFICHTTKKSTQTCLNCSYNKRISCKNCHKNLTQCQLCSKRYICGYKCYVAYIQQRQEINSKEHLCKMYQCINTSSCIPLQSTKLIIKSESVECNCCILN